MIVVVVVVAVVVCCCCCVDVGVAAVLQSDCFDVDDCQLLW